MHAVSVTTNWNTNGHLMFLGSITYIKQGNDVYDISYYLSLYKNIELIFIEL